MASLIYNRFFYNFGAGAVKWTATSGDSYMIALVSSSYTASKKHNRWNNADTTLGPSNFEVTGTGYNAGGTKLTSLADSQGRSNGDTVILDAADVTWSSSTITAAGAVIWDRSRSDSSLVAYFDFGGNKSSSSGDFTLQWSTNGIFNLYQG
jgi:hypothetical protein